jgi:hypothetical protein
VVIARMVRSVADNAGEDVCDALPATAAIPSVLANLQKALQYSLFQVSLQG